MDERQWRNERDDRTLRYAGRRLDLDRWITVTADGAYAESYEGQVAILTATNLLGRMSPSVALGFPDARLDLRLPWAARSLHEVVLAQMQAADPYGRFCVRSPLTSDFRLHLGHDGHSTVAHGLGWNAYIGPAPSPLPTDVDNNNPVGPALAAILAVSRLFVHDLAPPAHPFLVNALTWSNAIAPDNPSAPIVDLGDIWIVGAGSVGTAVLYFLVLAGRPFSTTLIDMDRVKRENLDRSPIFAEADVGELKVEAARRFLVGLGLDRVQIDPCPLHESWIWTGRSAGQPDILVSAANEMNVRYHIESQYPPIQLYGTTGRNWQASLVRHVPFVDACSCCLFPQDIPQPAMTCASAPIGLGSGSASQVDAALPFLSFAAGLMTAAEALKLALPGYPFSTNRVTLVTRPFPRLVPARIPRRSGCICSERSYRVHRRMLEGSKYTHLALSESA